MHRAFRKTGTGLVTFNTSYNFSFKQDMWRGCITLRGADIGSDVLGDVVIYAEISSIKRSTFNLSAYFRGANREYGRSFYFKRAVVSESVATALLIAKTDVEEMFLAVGQGIKDIKEKDINECYMEGLHQQETAEES